MLRETDLLDRTSIQSFDWAVLRLVRAAEPRLRLNAITNTDYLQLNRPGASPWLAGLDIDDFDGSIPAAVSTLGFDAISPSHTILTPAMVAEAHEAGLRVLPYTVDAAATMRRLIEIGVDGMITQPPRRSPLGAGGDGRAAAAFLPTDSLSADDDRADDRTDATADPPRTRARRSGRGPRPRRGHRAALRAREPTSSASAPRPPGSGTPGSRERDAPAW